MSAKRESDLIITSCDNRLQTELDDTMSSYQLIITITISEKQKVLIGKKLLIEIFQNSHWGKYLQQRHYLKLQILLFWKSPSRDG